MGISDYGVLTTSARKAALSAAVLCGKREREREREREERERERERDREGEREIERERERGAKSLGNRSAVGGVGPIPLSRSLSLR